MDKEQTEARVRAIEYIIEDKLYNEELEDEIFGELSTLKALLSNKPNIDSVLNQRREQYGDYTEFVNNMTEIMNILDRPVSQTDIMKYRAEDIENFFLVLKLLRMQTADDLDSITDLIGYATLAKERREK